MPFDCALDDPATPLVTAPRLTLLVAAALAALAGCGSGKDSGMIVVDHPNPDAPIAYAYVASAAATPGSAGAVYEYAILSDYSVSPLTPASVGAGISPSALVVNAGHVYVVIVGDGTISQYTIGADNTLTPMNPASVTNPGMHTFGGTSGAAAVDPSGNYLYVANSADDTLSQFGIGGDGRLTPLAPSTVATGSQPVAIVTNTSSSGGVVYVVASGALGDIGTVAQYSEAANGTLTPANAAPLPAGTNPSGMAIDAAYSTAYVLSNCNGTQCTGSITQFTDGNSALTDGSLTDTGIVVTTASHFNAASMVIDGAGANGYVLGNQMGVDTLSGALWHFQVGSTGALTAASASPVTLAGVAVAQALPIQGSALYVLTTNTGANAGAPATGGSIALYTLGTGGTPTLEATTTLAAPYPAALGIKVLLPP